MVIVPHHYGQIASWLYVVSKVDRRQHPEKSCQSYCASAVLEFGTAAYLPYSQPPPAPGGAPCAATAAGGRFDGDLQDATNKFESVIKAYLENEKVQ